MTFTDKIIFWVASGIILGVVISSLDRYIYQLFMGNGVLPEFVLDVMYSLLLKDFDGLEEDFKSTNSRLSLIPTANSDEEIKQNIKQLRSLRHKNADVCYKLREYPFNNDLRQVYPRTPTRLGNVITEYESYSEEQYGMNFHVFWSRIWQILPKSGKDDLDIRGAKADSAVYLLLIWILFSPFMGYSAYVLIGITSIVLFLVPWLIIARLLYDAAVHAHENYGGYVKAAFDVRRIDFAKKIGIPVSLCPTTSERLLWMSYREYLEEYNIPEGYPWQIPS